jgi:hypothetical protein
MNRMFGFFSCAAAGAAIMATVKPTANAAPTPPPASRAITLRNLRLIIFSVPLLCEMRNKLHGATARPTVSASL